MRYPWINQANVIFTGVLVGQFLLSLIIAFFTDTFAEAIIGSLLFISLPLLLIRTSPFAVGTRVSVGIAVQLMTALHIQQAAGLTEIHFEIFVMLAFLSFYRDWRVILASVVTVALHHVIFFTIQSQGGGVYIFEEGHLSFGILIVHALFALTEGLLLMYVAHLIHQEAIAANSLSHSIHKMLEVEGEFNLTVDIDRENEALSEFVSLIDSFRSLIGRASQTSEDVCQTARDVEKLTQEISLGASFNTEQTTNIATAIEQMSVTNEDVASRAAEANVLSKECSDNTEAAKDTMKQSSDDIKALDLNLGDASATINELASMCKKIDDAMASIKSVADQTNLLALNAAIESARAGEHGRGFAVVADEVRQLASTTSSHADEISGITASLISEANQSVEKINHCVERADNTKVSSNDAAARMDDVSTYTSQLDGNIDSVATAVEEQSAVSNDIARSAQQLHDSTDEQQTKIQLSTGSIEDLIKNIDSLHMELTKFRV